METASSDSAIMDSTRMYGPAFAITHALDDDLKLVRDHGDYGPASYRGPVGIHAMPYVWRLLDDDGNVCAKGICNEGGLDGAPLFMFGEGMFGCTSMEVRENGEWIPHIG